MRPSVATTLTTMHNDYSFFHQSLNAVRKFKGCHPYAIERGAVEMAGEAQFLKAPKILVPADEHGENCVFESTSYATSPGHGLSTLQSMVGHTLPEDFTAFHEQFEKALVVSRACPLHLWSEDQIVESIHRFREFPDKPFRVFRFGDLYEIEATQFGLWLEEPGSSKWKVITTAPGVIDDMDDDSVEPSRIVGDSFHSWLQKWIEQDGSNEICLGWIYDLA
jgi:hypothetical protein